MGGNPVVDGGNFGRPTIAIQAWIAAIRCLRRVQAHSTDIRYLTSLSVKVAPNDWPRSAIDFALPSSLAARVP